MKRSNKTMFVLAAVLLCVTLLFTACGGEKRNTSAEEGKGVHIALLNASSGNSWRAQMESEMAAFIEELKADGTVASYVAYSADDDATLQSQQLSQLISAGQTNIVIINPVSATSLNPVIDKAIAAGIVVLGVDSVIEHPDVVTLATDQYAWAAMQAEFLAEKLGKKGKIVIYNAIAGFPASDTRELAFDEVIAKYPDIEVLKKVYHNWDEGEAKQLTTTMISTYPQIDGVLNQDCSPGIMQGFTESGKDMPKVMTSDGSITYLNMWNDYNTANPDKAFEGIIVGNPPGMGCSAIKIGLQMMAGKEFADGALTESSGGMAILLDPVPVITNENREEWVGKTKSMNVEYTFSAVLTDGEVAGLFK